jgi:pyruvate formate-lyase/glycerol dehydratase family glycyl radical enzyme
MTSEVKPFQIQTKAERTPRIEDLYHYITSFTPGICVERIHYLTESYKKNSHLPTMVRRATAIANVLDNMSIYILPGSLLAGNQTSKPRWAPLFPEFDMKWMEEEILEGNPFYPYDRPADKYEFRPDDKGKLQDALSWWKGKTHTDRLVGSLPKEALHTHADIKAVDIGAYFQGGDGHFSPDHKWLFEHGLQFMIVQCKEALQSLNWLEPDSVQKKEFYEAAIVSCEAVIRFANRYADLAEEMAKVEEDTVRQAELLKIAENCRWVPQKPARNFYEALQFMYFIHLCIQIEDNGAGISIGRYDQIMWDLYVKDVQEGSLTRELALELTENFYLQIYTLNKVRSWIDTDFFRGVPMFQNLTVGGQDPVTKCDSTNELSYIALEATANTRVPQPSLTVRFHRKTPLNFKMKVAEVIRLGMGLPSIFNDEVYIPAMINRGYEINDAYNYCIIGCVEPGTSGLLGGRTGGAWLNLTKILEISLYNGQDQRTGLTLHTNKNEKDLSSFSSFEEAKAAYLDQLNYYITMEAILENTIDQLWEDHLEEPMAAIFGCPTTTIPRGKPLKKGGAKYDLTGQQTIGTANIANSLYAVKKLVFDDKLLTGEQLLHALKTSFQDATTCPTGPEIKAMCLSVDKYGNDIDEVDDLAREMLAYVASTLVKFKNTRHGRGPIGCTLHCSTSTVSSNTPFGKVCGATPDGRDAWTSVADGQSPMRGTDKKGPTAAIASVSKLNNILLSCGSLYNLRFVPEDLR